LQKRIPIRKCVACGTRKSKEELIRIVNNKGQILIDPGGKMPGRGAYICPSNECFKKARKSNKISNALKTSIPDEVYNKLAEEIGNQ